jgi:hypothetical protein
VCRNRIEKDSLMTRILAMFVVGLLTIPATQLRAEIQISSEHLDAELGFCFEQIPLPAVNDAGSRATWTMISGQRDDNGARIAALNDGRVPANEDQPRSNFFFRAGTAGGRILADLGKANSIKRISSYSRHVGDRAPQVYTVYGSNGDIDVSKLSPNSSEPLDPGQWQRIAAIDTRPTTGESGGTYGVSITSSQSSVGPFRYLLFLVEPTEKRDPFGLTFFSEIDIVTDDDPDLNFVSAGTPLNLIKSQTSDKRYQFQINVTEAPELKEWSQKELLPVMNEWYPRIVEMLPSDGYQAATKVRLQYRNDMAEGIPASASGAKISLNAPWFRKHLNDEAKGCVVHELVHVVQDYWRPRPDGAKSAEVPGWFIEGLADYIRWFKFEPQSRGAELSSRQLAKARYDASYRVSAHFIDWVVRTYDQDLVKTLNAAARNGKYSDSLWELSTRKRINDLAEEWRKGE